MGISVPRRPAAGPSSYPPGGHREGQMQRDRRRALVDGEWDTTALMRSNAGVVGETARALPYVDD